jgi:hypothetical protein
MHRHRAVAARVVQANASISLTSKGFYFIEDVTGVVLTDLCKCDLEFTRQLAILSRSLQLPC